MRWWGMICCGRRGEIDDFDDYCDNNESLVPCWKSFVEICAF